MISSWYYKTGKTYLNPILLFHLPHAYNTELLSISSSPPVGHKPFGGPMTLSQGLPRTIQKQIFTLQSTPVAKLVMK